MKYNTLPRGLQNRLGLVAVLVALPLIGCPPPPEGLETRSFEVDGRTRTFEVFVPSHAKGTSLPLVILLHRFTETGGAIARSTNLNEVAEREGFIAAYPNAINRSFNAFDDGEVDDIGFILGIVDLLSSEYTIDPARVYLAGASNGGFMTWRIACEAPGVFAAIAVVMATMPASIAEDCAEAPPLPIVLIHGTADPIVPYLADTIEGPPGRVRPVLPIPDTVAFWLNRNNAIIEPIVEELPNFERRDRTSTQRFTYPAGESGAEVVLYAVQGGGHTWPGGDERLPKFIVGRTSGDFSASEAIWDFFARHQAPN